MRDLLGQAQLGQLTTARVPTMAEWMDTYLREVATPRIRPNTLQSYRDQFRLHIEPEIGRVRLDKLRPQDLNRLYTSKTSTLANSSVRRLHALLRRALNVAVRWGLISINPALVVDPPALTVHEIAPYSLKEAREFLVVAQVDRLYARWLLATMLGLRQGEVLGLTWLDIDLPRSRLHVRRSLQRQPDGVLALVETKTSRSRRTIPLPASLVVALEDRLNAQQDERALAGDIWRESDLVFTTRNGTAISPRNDYRSFRRITEVHNLRAIRLHDLRHTAASLLLAEGIAGRVVMEILGHSQISITMNTYTHVATELSQIAADKVEEALWTRGD